jgi:hypothetical protein
MKTKTRFSPGKRLHAKVLGEQGRMTGNSPGNKRVSRLFPVTTDGAKRRPVLGSNASAQLTRRSQWVDATLARSRAVLARHCVDTRSANGDGQ